MMRNILITGGAGFLGTNLIDYIADLGEDLHITVVGTYDSELSRQRKEHLEKTHPGLCTFENVDITRSEDVDEVFRKTTPELVIHLAAIGNARGDVGKTINVNVEGTRNIVDAATRYGAPRLYYQSTGLVYGAFDTPTWVHESTSLPTEGLSAYAQSKADGERIVKESGLKHYVFGRICNVFGPWENKTELVSRAIRGKDFSVAGDGSQTRQFLYVRDAVEAIWAVANFGEDGQVINIAPEGSLPIREAAAQIQNKTVDELTYNPDAPTGGSAADMDNSRLKHILRLALPFGRKWPVFSFKEGLELTRPWHEFEASLEAKRELSLRSTPETV